MATKSTKRVMPTPTITANDIRHFINGKEYASVPEVIVRLGLGKNLKDAGSLYNLVQANKATLLPKPEVYGYVYLYPVAELEQAVQKVQESLGKKRESALQKQEQNTDIQRLTNKIKSNPELAKVLLGLLD